MVAPRALVLGLFALLLAVAVANADAASVVVGLAKCADCTRKNMKAEEAFKGLQVAIKCKNVHGEYESKAVGGLDGTGAFSVPLAADLHGADCVAQLHSAASNAPCPGQEPSKVVPVSQDTTYGVVAGVKTPTTSSECASVTVCGPVKKFLGHFHHKQPAPPKPEPKPQPQPNYHPVPPTPTYGGGGGHPSTPIYHVESKTFLGPLKKHIIYHFHHKKPVPPMPEPKPQPHPDYHPVPPTPTYGGGGGHPSTPIYHADSKTFFGPFKKHMIDHFHHNKPMPPKPEPKPQPNPDYHPVPPTPMYGGGGGHPSTPIYHAESKTFLGPFKKHIIGHFHHKKPVPPKLEPKPQPHPDYHPVPPSPNYGGGDGHPSTPIYHADSKTFFGPFKKHMIDHFHHNKPMPPKPEPKPQPNPDYHPVPPTPMYGGGGGHPSTPIYHAESKTFLGPFKKHIIGHFHHKKPVPPKPEPKPQPHPDYHPVPPSPNYGGGDGHPSTLIYHAESKTFLGPIKKHIIDHFHHKKPVPPKPEPKPQPHPDYHTVPPTPTYNGGGGHPSTPIYHAESKTFLGPTKKHIIEHFHHKKPMPSKPEPKPQPQPDYYPVPPTPTYGSGGGHPSTPIYHPPSQH